MTLYRPIPFIHQVLKEHLNQESYVVDATCGHGHDSLFIANILGKNGKLFGFDIQEAAIYNTHALLEDCATNISLFQISHQEMDDVLDNYFGKIDAVVFNLGFLPHTDETITTEIQSTLKAVQAAYNLLRKKGLILIATYPGHAAGLQEDVVLKQLFSNISQKDCYITTYHQMNIDTSAPKVYVIEKRSQVNPFSKKDTD